MENEGGRRHESGGKSSGADLVHRTAEEIWIWENLRDYSEIWENFWATLRNG